MVPNHSKTLVRDGALVLHDVVEVLVVAPAQHDIVHATARCVDTVLGAVDLILVVWVVLESVGVDDLGGVGAADRECVANYVPLALGVVEEKELAEVVNKTYKLEPTRLSIAANGFGRLEEMLDLREGGVWVGFVDECVELLHCFPDGHLCACLGVEGVARLEIVADGLLLVLLAVEVLHAVACFFVLAELGLVLLSIEFGFLVDVLLFLCRGAVLDLHGGLEDVDIVNGVGSGF